MIIKYNQNPLWSEIKLSETESKELWYKLKIEELTTLLGNIEYYANKKEPDIKKVKLYSESSFYNTDNNDIPEIDKRVNEIHEMLLKSLEYYHIGDCVSIPCTCLKCMTESLIGKNTLSIGKGSANYILDAFTVNGTVLKDYPINKALDILQGECTPYDELDDISKHKWEQLGGKTIFETHIPKWNAEKKDAYEWLLEHKHKHGF